MKGWAPLDRSLAELCHVIEGILREGVARAVPRCAPWSPFVAAGVSDGTSDPGDARLVIRYSTWVPAHEPALWGPR